MPEAAEIAITEIIGKEEDHIRLLRCQRRSQNGE
jgi:hypothetical protein